MRFFQPSPYLLLTLSSLFWAGNWIVGRGIRAEVPPVTLSFWRWVIALVCILPLAWPHLRRDAPALRAAWPWIGLLGLFGVFAYNTFSYIGLQYTTVTNGLLLNSFIPMLIVALAWVFQGKRLRRIEGLGVVASTLGVMTIVVQGDPAKLLSLHFNIGDFWVLGAVLSWAIYTLLLPRKPAGVHPLSFLFAIASVGLAATFPAYLWELASGRHVIATPAALGAMLYAGVFAALLGFICWNKGVAEVGAARAGLFIHLMPVFGILLAALFLGERMAAYHLVGIVLIFGGIFLTTRR